MQKWSQTGRVEGGTKVRMEDARRDAKTYGGFSRWELVSGT